MKRETNALAGQLKVYISNGETVKVINIQFRDSEADQYGILKKRCP